LETYLASTKVTWKVESSAGSKDTFSAVVRDNLKVGSMEFYEVVLSEVRQVVWMVFCLDIVLVYCSVDN